MAILISGIGRSGTTTIYQILGKGLINKFEKAKCVYEPYLWKLPEVENVAEVKGQPFSVEQIGLFNVNVHCNTPLFLSERNSLHDYWLRTVFGPISMNSRQAPEHVMAKVIRGAGRLEAALTMFENLKVVIITRNIIDTANSGLGLFSFFGDEFHPSDKKRFISEVNRHFNAGLDDTLVRNELDWSVLWWHYLTEASFQTYLKFKSRVMLVPYEHYVTDKLGTMQRIYDFVGLEQKYIDHSLFEKGAGPVTSNSYLKKSELVTLAPELDWYFQRLAEVAGIKIDAGTYFEGLKYKFSKREYVRSLLLSKPTNLTAVQWRVQLGNELAKNRANSLKVAPAFSVSSALAEFHSDVDQLHNLEKNKSATINNNKYSIGVLITCFNNQASIAEAIYSVLNQSRKADLIYVADDCSRDNSVLIIEDIMKRHTNVSLVKRPMNVGVSANRDLAIREMDVDFITTLDGDDLFFPHKLEAESLAINGENDKVAFSDIVVIGAGQSFLKSTDKYHKKDKRQLLTQVCTRSAPVPRDMMFSKELFLKVDGFDVGMTIYEDWAFKIRLMSVAEARGWVHSGCKGTIYDRRTPGLSGKQAIAHAYGQLQALARNYLYLHDNKEAIIGGLNTVKTQLNGGMRANMEVFIKKTEQNGSMAEVLNKLELFWAQSTFGDCNKTKFEHIWEFSSIKGMN